VGTWWRWNVTNLTGIFKAFQRTGTSVQKKRSVFEWPNLVRYLFYQIKNNNLLKERFSCFVVKDPKLREVFAPALKDRVLHHFLVDRLSPLLDKTLIFDSFANRPGKGTHGAVRRLQKMMRQGGPQQQWYLHADIAAYYTSISKPLLLRVIEKKINKIKNISWREKEHCLPRSHQKSKVHREEGTTKSHFSPQKLVWLPCQDRTSYWEFNEPVF